MSATSVDDVGRLAHDAALAGEVEQARDDLLAAVGLVDDQLEVVLDLGVAAVALDLLEQDVGLQQQDAERVVDLVGDAGRELAHAGQLLRLDQRLLGALERAVRLLEVLRPWSQSRSIR